MQMFAIGSYTTRQGHAPDAGGKGLSILGMDDSEKLREISVRNDLENPAYLTWDKARRLLYTASETGSSPGRVDLFSLNGEGGLKHLSGTEGNNGDACHIGLSSRSGGLYTAAYGAGQVSSFRLDGDGRPRLTGSINYEGNGPNKDRQESPHAHQIVASPYTDQLYVCDLGTDSIWLHRDNPEAFPRSGEQPNPALKLPGGYGPRHLVFDNHEPIVYILCELVPRIVTARIDGDSGSLTILQDISSTADEKESQSPLAPAAIKIHPSGKTLAVSNRFRDTVAVFEINRSKGSAELTFTGEFSCGGKTPRDIEFDQEGSLLFIANQDSHEINSLRFDPGEGLCTGEPGPSIKTGSPVCIVRL